MVNKKNKEDLEVKSKLLELGYSKAAVKTIKRLYDPK